MPQRTMARHNHRHHVHRREQNEGIQERADTVVSVVYVTAAKTFAGPIGGYQTLDGSSQNPAAAAKPTPQPEQPTQQQSQQQDQSASQQQQQQSQTQPSPQPSPSPEPAPSSPQTSAAQATPTESTSTPQATTTTRATESATHTDEASSRSTEATQTAAHGSHTSLSDSVASSAYNGGATSSIDAQPSSVDSSASSATSSASSATKASSGMSGGAKAGLAFGIIIVIGALIALALFAIRRKKRQNEAYGKTVDEKAGLGGAGAGIGRSASVQTSKTSETAPRLSLRPVTQFLPDLAGKRKSGNLLGGASLAPPNGRGENPTLREQANNPANPFGNHAEMSEKAPAQYAPNNPANPFSNHGEVSRSLASAGPDMNAAPSVPAPLSIRSPSPVGSSAAAAGVGAVAGAAAVGALAGHRQDAPKPLNLAPNRAASPAPGQPSPAGTEFSMTPVSPGAFANGPPPSNVHRVQMDFKPSMDDELGLRAGQLVRLLHEYDDGWVSPRHVNWDSLCTDTLIGSLHPSRSFSTRCRSSYLLVCSPSQATPTSWCSCYSPTRPSSTRHVPQPASSLFSS